MFCAIHITGPVPDITNLEFFLWGHNMVKIFTKKVNDIEERRIREGFDIRTPPMFRNTWCVENKLCIELM